MFRRFLKDIHLVIAVVINGDLIVKMHAAVLRLGSYSRLRTVSTDES